MLYEQISQSCRPLVKGLGFWGSVKALTRGSEYMMGLILFTPVAILAWFPFARSSKPGCCLTKPSAEGFKFNIFWPVKRRTSKTNQPCTNTFLLFFFFNKEKSEFKRWQKYIHRDLIKETEKRPLAPPGPLRGLRPRTLTVRPSQKKWLMNLSPSKSRSVGG